MVAMDQQNPLLSERVAKLETAIETERPHLATKDDVSVLRGDVERQTRLLIMWFVVWFVGMALTVLGLIMGVFLHLNEQLNAVLSSLP